MTNPCDRNPDAPAFPKSLLISSRTEHQDLTLQIEGTLPSDLYGHAFVIGPAGAITSPAIPNTDCIQPSQDGTPLFNGDAMIYRFDFEHASQGRVALTNKLAKTPCYYTDEACTKDPKYHSLQYDDYGLARLSLSLGFRNEINTALIPLKFSDTEPERLIITWDAGRPYEIDPQSLEIATPVGWNSEWREQIQLPFAFGITTTTAHAGFDPQSRQLFSVNYGKSIPTALAPLIHVNGEVLWSELGQFLEQLESFLSPIAKVLAWSIGLEHKLVAQEAERLRESSVWQTAKAKLGSAIAKSLLALHHQWVNAQTHLPHLATVHPRYHTLLHNILTVLETTLDRGLSEFSKLLQDILKVLQGLRYLLPAAIEMEDFVDLIAWDGKGALQKWSVRVQEDGELRPVQIEQSMHQIAVTQDYVVLMDTVFKLGAEQLITTPFPNHPQMDVLLRDLVDFDESADTVIYIVPRSELTCDRTTVTAKKVVIPRGAAHFVADYANPNHQITLHLAHNTAWDPAEWTRSYDQPHFPNVDMPLGMSVAGMDLNHWGRYVVNGETGELGESTLLTDYDRSWMTAIYTFNGVNPPDQFQSIYWNSWGSWPDLLSEFIYQDYKDYAYREMPVQQVMARTQAGVPANLCRIDTQVMQVVDSYAFPPGYFGNSTQFIPRAGVSPDPTADPSTNGYLLSIVHSAALTHTQFWIFDAQDLAKGPLCKLSHPSLKLGMTIHSTWMSEVQPRQAQYNVPVPEDYQALLERFPNPERQALIKDLFETAVYPQFQS